MKVYQPYLVQRGKVADVVSHEKKFSENVKTDYMGSAEFEFGALPKSLRAIHADLQKYHIVQIKDISFNENPLILWTKLPFVMIPEYVEFLKEMHTGNLRLKESSHFQINTPPLLVKRTDFWWDLDNDLMFSFRPDIMKVLPGSIETSVKYMELLRAEAAVETVVSKYNGV